MKRNPVQVIDPVMKAYADRIQQLIDRIEALRASPADYRTQVESDLMTDIETMKRDLNAELITRNPPPGWDVLEQRLGGIEH